MSNTPYPTSRIARPRCLRPLEHRLLHLHPVLHSEHVSLDGRLAVFVEHRAKWKLDTLRQPVIVETFGVFNRGGGPRRRLLILERQHPEGLGADEVASLAVC